MAFFSLSFFHFISLIIIFFFHFFFWFLGIPLLSLLPSSSSLLIPQLPLPSSSKGQQQ